MKDSFHKEQGPVFFQFPKYHVDILLSDFNESTGTRDIFKPTNQNDNLHEISNDNGVRVINFAISRNLTVKNSKLLHRNILIRLDFSWLENT